MRRPVQIHHDKETYSETDLTEVGAYKYAVCPTTDCLLTSGLVDFGKHGGRERKLRRWRPGWEYPYADIDPDDLVIHAWNSQFERLIWNRVMVPRYGWPQLRLEQFVCVSAQARMMAAGPSKLEKAAQFYGAKVRKDMKGHAHMLKMCRPATDKQQLDWHEGRYIIDRRDRENLVHRFGADAVKRCHHTPEAIDRLHDYCDPDVWAEVGVADILPPWHGDDLAAFHLSERINDEGIIVDVDFAQAATAYAEDEKAYFAEEIDRLTDGAVTTPRQFVKIKDWVLPLLSPEARKVARWFDNGEEKYSFDADTRANLIQEATADMDWLTRYPEDAELVLEFLELLDAAGKSAIAKYEAIRKRAIRGEDGLWRVHGCYMLAGASQSTRYSSTGIQAHNLVRDVPKNARALIRAFKAGDSKAVEREVKAWADEHNAKATSARLVKPEPIHVLARLVRPTITACPDDTFDLLWCDWSSIEACVLPWLSLDPRADDRLAMLRRGEDIYLKTASGIVSDIRGTRVVITKADEFERQAFGKVPELSLGYLGGAGAFKAMAKNYGVSLGDKTINRVVKAWREANPWAMDFGTTCETAAKRAINRPGVGFSAGRLEYIYEPKMLGGLGALLCVLPSGKELVYPGARIEPVVTKWGETVAGITAMKASWNPKKDEPDWPRVSLWKGLLVENPSQAVATGANGILGLGLARCEKAGLRVFMQTHDEIVIQTDDPMRDGPLLEKLMTQRPNWPGADALPLRAEWDYGFRYKVKLEKVKEAA